MTAIGRAPRIAAQATIQRELAHEQRVFGWLVVDAAVGAQNAERHRQVEAGAFLANVCRSQVDGGNGRRNVVAGVLQRRADTLAALAHRRVGQSNGDELALFIRLEMGDIDLNLDQVGVDAIHGRAECLVKHEAGEQESQ